MTTPTQPKPIPSTCRLDMRLPRLRAAASALTAVSALCFLVPAAQAASVSGYVDGVVMTDGGMFWRSTTEFAFNVPLATGRLYFSYDTSASVTILPGQFSVPLVGELSYVSNAFTATTTLTGAESNGPSLAISDNVPGLGSAVALPSLVDYMVFRTTGPTRQPGTNQWRITIPGVPTVDAPDNLLAMEFSAMLSTDTFDAGNLKSSTVLSTGDLVTQNGGLVGTALRNGVPTVFSSRNLQLSFVDAGDQLVITSGGGGTVPEPSVLALLTIAAAGAGLASNRRAARAG